MGGVLSALWSWLFPPAQLTLPPDADTPHPATGVTGRQRVAVQASWRLVAPDAKRHGIAIFIRLFKKHPETQLVFKSFKGQQPESLADNKRLAAHATTVMASVATLVDNLDDIDTLLELLNKVAENHKRRGLPIQYFEMVSNTIFDYLVETLGAALDRSGVEGWSNVFRAINSVIAAEYKRLEG